MAILSCTYPTCDMADGTRRGSAIQKNSQNRNSEMDSVGNALPRYLHGGICIASGARGSAGVLQNTTQ